MYACVGVDLCVSVQVWHMFADACNDFTYKTLQQGQESSFNFTLTACHPGYVLTSGRCVCDTNDSNVLHCDADNRYIFVRVSVMSQHICTTTHYVV